MEANRFPIIGRLVRPLKFNYARDSRHFRRS
jgi:hypothetical protein